MFFVGIDISKFKHDCAVLDASNTSVVSSFSFENNAHGFMMLLNALSSLPKESTTIGFEATGHYGCNLKNFLLKNGYSFSEINPLLIRNFSKQKSLRRTKTDLIDAKLIALYLSQNYSSLSDSYISDKLVELKELCRFRFCLQKQRKLYLLRLNNLLDYIFPEFKPIFANRFTATAFYILSHYSSVQTIANMNSRSFETLKSISKGRFSMKLFVNLKQAAKNTVGIYSESRFAELKIVVEMITDISTKIEMLEKSLTTTITEINPPSLSIRGIGPLSVAVIISEYGNIKRFASPNAMLAFAGLEPGVFQSGTSCSSSHMVKHGSSFLRYTLINCCRTLILHNEIFATYYLKKISEGKHYNVALTHLAKKLIRLIFALETKGEVFNSSKQR